MIYYYPPAGYDDDGIAKLWRRASLCEPSGNMAYVAKIPHAERVSDNTYYSGRYLVICDQFFTVIPPPTDLQNSIPLDAWDLGKHTTQSDILLHEFMHMRYDDIGEFAAIKH